MPPACGAGEAQRCICPGGRATRSGHLYRNPGLHNGGPLHELPRRARLSSISPGCRGTLCNFAHLWSPNRQPKLDRTSGRSRPSSGGRAFLPRMRTARRGSCLLGGCWLQLKLATKKLLLAQPVKPRFITISGW